MAQHQVFPSIEPFPRMVGRDGFEPSKSKTTDLQSLRNFDPTTNSTG